MGEREEKESTNTFLLLRRGGCREPTGMLVETEGSGKGLDLWGILRT